MAKEDELHFSDSWSTGSRRMTITGFWTIKNIWMTGGLGLDFSHSLHTLQYSKTTLMFGFSHISLSSPLHAILPTPKERVDLNSQKIRTSNKTSTETQKNSRPP
jgi:uncharacterized membrane protein YhiD involved in acid resistance